MRVILYSGKGGVGKTTIACASAIRLASLGYRVILISLDPAHSVSDAFDLQEIERLKTKGLPKEVLPNLFIQEIDIQEELQRHWGDVYKFLELLFNRTGFNSFLSEELAVLPGMEEVTSLLYVKKYMQEKSYDAIVLDLPPTGESLRFVAMPWILRWYMKSVFKTERTLTGIVRPIVKRLTDIPVPEDSYFRAIESFYKKIEGIENVLLDTKTTSVRLVANPEKMVIRETQRAFMYFSMFGMNVDCVFINRVYEETLSDCPKLSGWIKTQSKHLSEVESLFSPVPLIKVPLMSDEVVGKDRLNALSEAIFREINPIDILYDGKPYEFLKENDKTLIKIKVPFITKEGLSVIKSDDELLVRWGNFKSTILLPRGVRELEPDGARIENGYLTISLKEAQRQS
ncbi:MAG: TRC40/GET3/ArsA family transport-energizing ATPase [Aquificaceae bacterium]